jgi:two-component system, response regulator PdtaR
VCHVLIIEDEILVAMHIETLLEDAGATSFAFAASEEEAVASAQAMRPGLITSDVKLSDGAGPAAVRRILAEMGPIPVIFITATPEDCALSDPPMTVLVKPLMSEALATAYHGYVDDRGYATVLNSVDGASGGEGKALSLGRASEAQS